MASSHGHPCRTWTNIITGEEELHPDQRHIHGLDYIESRFEAWTKECTLRNQLRADWRARHAGPRENVNNQIESSMSDEEEDDGDNFERDEFEEEVVGNYNVSSNDHCDTDSDSESELDFGNFSISPKADEETLHTGRLSDARVEELINEYTDTNNDSSDSDNDSNDDGDDDSDAVVIVEHDEYSDSDDNNLTDEDTSNVRPGSESDCDSEAEETVLDATLTRSDANKLKEEGNTFYRTGHYEAAVGKYTEALHCPAATDDERATYLCNRSAVNLKLRCYPAVISDTHEALRLVPDYKKALHRRMQAYEALKQYDEALSDASKLGLGKEEIGRLTNLKNREKEEEEEEQKRMAIEGLKKVGNAILSNFGLSTDDFELRRDGATGSMNITQKKKEGQR